MAPISLSSPFLSSGAHELEAAHTLIQAPELGGELNGLAQGLIATLAHVSSEQVGQICANTFPILQGVAKIGPLALLFLTGVILPFVLGAFAGGLILSSSKRREAIEKAIQPLVALLATGFFSCSSAAASTSPCSIPSTPPTMRDC